MYHQKFCVDYFEFEWNYVTSTLIASIFISLENILAFILIVV